MKNFKKTTLNAFAAILMSGVALGTNAQARVDEPDFNNVTASGSGLHLVIRFRGDSLNRTDVEVDSHNNRVSTQTVPQEEERLRLEEETARVAAEQEHLRQVAEDERLEHERVVAEQEHLRQVAENERLERERVAVEQERLRQVSENERLERERVAAEQEHLRQVSENERLEHERVVAEQERLHKEQQAHQISSQSSVPYDVRNNPVLYSWSLELKKNKAKRLNKKKYY